MTKNLIYQRGLVLERKRPVGNTEWDHDFFRLYDKISLDRYYHIGDVWFVFPLRHKFELMPIPIPLSYIKKYFRNTNKMDWSYFK